MKFNVLQLKEIEKVFDVMAGQSVQSFAAYAASLDKVAGEKAGEIIKPVLDDHLSCYNFYRTISAVAAKMQEEAELDSCRVDEREVKK